MKLFKAELLLFVKSLTFVAFCVAAFAFYFTQYQSNVNHQVAHFQENTVYDPANYLMQPKSGSKDYGRSQKLDTKVVMKNVLLSLKKDYHLNTFQTYPFMFNKSKHLDKKEKKQLNQLFKQITNQSLSTFNPKKVSWQKIYQNTNYSQFKHIMGKIDRIIGGNSIYVPSELHDFYSGKELSYHAASRDYQKKMQVEQVSHAFARLFSDYFGMIMLLFSIFPLVLYYTKARRENCRELLNLKTKPTWQYLGIKYLTTILIFYVFTLLFSIFPAVQLVKIGRILKLYTDGWAFVKTVTIFVLPTIAFISALVLLLTQIFKPVVTMSLSIAFGVFILAVTDPKGYTLWSPLIRLSAYEDWSTFASLKQGIYFNRLVYIGITLILFLMAVWLKSRKKKG